MKLVHGTILFLTAGLVCLSVFLITGYRDSVSAGRDTPVVTSFTISVETPSSIRFCGKEVDLTRYNMREGMDRELNGFVYNHSTTLLLIKRANRYFPIIVPILRANGIPDDFKYLAVIESHLDPTAVSAAHAVGMWQFLESTGKRYGLRVTATVDERKHVVKSTRAACKYLMEAYGKYGDWVAVASSYNAGMGRISGQIEKQQQASTLNLHLAEESMRYPYRIFAVKQIFENPYKYGFVLKAEDLYRPINGKEVPVEGDVPDLVELAREYGITYYDLKYFNPWMKDTKLATGGGTYHLLIPDRNDLYYPAANTRVYDKGWVVR